LHTLQLGQKHKVTKNKETCKANSVSVRQKRKSLGVCREPELLLAALYRTCKCVNAVCHWLNIGWSALAVVSRYCQILINYYLSMIADRQEVEYASPPESPPHLIIVRNQQVLTDVLKQLLNASCIDRHALSW